MENKTDAALSILSIVPRSELLGTEEYLTLLSFGQVGTWQIVVKYNGNIEEVARKEGGIAQLINDQFAVLTMPPDNIRNLLNYTEVEYMETPKKMIYNVTNMEASCITTVQNNPPYELTGEGVLLGIIDSGINYAHPDFRNEDGTTRIAYLWDQTITGKPPEGFLSGTEYTREQINEALSKPTRVERLAVVPSEDIIGHGTHVAGIAGGNGRGGGTKGVAPGAEFIIVKMGQPDFEGFVRNVEIMLAVRYILERATKLNKPVTINISIGMSMGPHDGNALIEQFLDDSATRWKNNIVVGSGNEGNTDNHTSGRVMQDGEARFEFQIGENVTQFNLSVWKSFIDEFEFQIIDPSGRQTPRLIYETGPVQYVLGGTKVYTTFAGPSPLNGDEEFAIYLSTANMNLPITRGSWTVVIYGVKVIDGRYNAWGPTVEVTGRNSYFLQPVETTTLTTPSTARLVISVGAYNHVTNQIAPFSGRGFGRNASVIKPDLVAPGVEISSASNVTSGYRVLSGTSMATPHVTGGVALLMQWGIVRGNNAFLYGENLKAYLLRGAKKDVPGVTYPSQNGDMVNYVLKKAWIFYVNN
ncbi:S8 family peptidase [Cellulosilyticum ruminicola]|uniref:S8 family peptidase n=1 Tax=Cellulosilyticum ruminicola TaxID=425254 RepID=UPI0006CF95DF|nr:S8 family peptidase [Cellulosilyticum ruminicola]